MRAVFARGFVAAVVGLSVGSCSGSDNVAIDKNDAQTSEDGGVVDPGSCQPENCPGTDTECSTRACKSGACAMDPTPYGTKLKEQKAGDCRVQKCDGNGRAVAIVDDTDAPDDQNPCTQEECSVGSVNIRNAPEGTSCGASLTCDGHGVCVGCNTAADCPGSDTECRTRTCEDNKCGVTYAAPGTVIQTQVVGDCLTNTCDGEGNVAPIINNVDVPVDNNPCTRDLCTAGVPSNPPEASGKTCNANGGTTCNGSGVCVQCLNASTCPGTDDECKTRTCTNNTCGMSYTANGTPVAQQTAGDCKERRCNGAGAIVSANLNTDVPVDNNPCTRDVCTAGVPSNPAEAPGTACNANGGTTCNGAGACVECTTAATCPGSDTECQTRTCNAGKCGTNFAGNGKAVSSQTPNDCKENRCDGAGHIVSANDDTDAPPDDGNQCTLACSGGTPNSPASPGTPCSQGGGTTCDGAGACVP